MKKPGVITIPRLKKKDSTKESLPSGVTPFVINKKDNLNGLEPYKRMIISWCFTLIISSVFGYIAWKHILLPIPPNNALELNVLAPWIVRSMVIPHAISFIIAAVISGWIISQSTLSYLKWLVWQSMGKLIIYFFSLEFALVVITMVTLIYQPDSNFIVTEKSADGLSSAIHLLWNWSVLSMNFPAWVAYIAMWVCYRKIGAQTMQDRYEEHLRKVEIKNSGRAWDKVTKLWVPRITGKDGHRPPWIVTGLFISSIVFSIFLSLGFVIGSSSLFGMGLLGGPLMIVSWFAALAKRRDGKMTLKRVPVLVPVRGADTVDTYDPAHTGVVQFHRR